MSALVLKTNLHVSSCLKTDIVDTVDKDAESNVSQQTDKPTPVTKVTRTKGFPDGPIHPDFK